MKRIPENRKSQSERFKQAARELECDDDEAAFNERLRRIAKEGGKPKGEKPDADK